VSAPWCIRSDGSTTCSSVQAACVSRPSAVAGATLTFSRMLIPLDGSRLSEQIIAPATALGRLTQAACTLLQVVEPSDLMHHGADTDVSDVEQSVTQRRLEAAREYLDDRAAQLRAEGMQVQTAIVGVNPPAAAILGHARQHEIDLIAMATHGRGGLARVLLGSTADKVVRGADMPVLLLRPREREA
jgi:nucleotide-binding universal stress UspA family protein